jgi:hypothetical protein
MKNNRTQILFLFIAVMCSNGWMLAQTPPPPSPPPPPGLPIDSSIVCLFFVALVLGYYITQKIKTKKAS